jgi:hypothetical protein
MLCKSKPAVGVSAEEFATFNEKLYYNDKLPVDHFELPGDMDKAYITAKEVQ